MRAHADGDLVVAAAREIIAALRPARCADLRVASSTRMPGVVRLAFLDSMATSLVPRLLREFHARAPRVRVLLRQEPAHEILDDLATGAAELAITSVRPPARPRLAAAAGGAARPRRAARRTGCAGARRVASPTSRASELVTTPPGYGLPHRSSTGCSREAGVALEVSFESADLATIEGLVAAGLGVAMVPEQFAGLSGSVGVPVTAAGGATHGGPHVAHRPRARTAGRPLPVLRAGRVNGLTGWRARCPPAGMRVRPRAGPRTR